MLSRLKYLLSFFAVVWGYFLIQKPIFMLCNAARHYPLADYVDVMWHAAHLDATTAGYLTILPFVVCLVSVWLPQLPLRRIATPYYMVAMLLVSLIFVGDLSLFGFWESKLDATIFVYIDSPKNAMASVSAWYVAWRVLLILAATAAVSALLWLVTPRRLGGIRPMSRRVAALLAALPIGLLLFVVIRGGVYVATANVGSVYYSSDQFLNLSAINPAFNLLSTCGQRARYADEFNFYPEPRRAELMDGLYATTDSATVQVLNNRRPNILVIFMESFGATMVERLGGAKGVAPNLERLASEGVFFSNAYASSFRTDRGTVCTFSAFPGLPTMSIMKTAGIARKMPNLAATLARNGYATDFLYGGDINFTNMRGYLVAGGFQKLTSQDDFSLADRNFSKWGVPDDITFNRLYDMLASRRDMTKPWFTAFLTLSSHEPFEVPFDKFADRHYNAFAYTDHCIGQFIDRFSKTPMWKNTLVVLLPDHGIPYPKQGERFGPRYFRIPIIWTGGAVARQLDVDRIMSQTDLVATLLAQMGISHDEFAYSRNVLSASYTRPFAFYSFVNGFGMVDSTGVSVYDNVANRVFYHEGHDGGNTRVNRGKAVLQTLYDSVGRIAGQQ